MDAGGIKIVLRVVEESLHEFVANAGVEPIVVVNQVAEGKENCGYNAANETCGDMIAMGVVDPTEAE